MLKYGGEVYLHLSVQEIIDIIDREYNEVKDFITKQQFKYYTYGIREIAVKHPEITWDDMKTIISHCNALINIIERE